MACSDTEYQTWTGVRPGARPSMPASACRRAAMRLAESGRRALDMPAAFSGFARARPDCPPPRAIFTG